MPVVHGICVAPGHHRREEEPAFVSPPAPIVLTRLLPDATTLRLDACSMKVRLQPLHQ